MGILSGSRMSLLFADLGLAQTDFAFRFRDCEIQCSFSNFIHCISYLVFYQIPIASSISQNAWQELLDAKDSLDPVVSKKAVDSLLDAYYGMMAKVIMLETRLAIKNNKESTTFICFIESEYNPNPRKSFKEVVQDNRDSLLASIEEMLKGSRHAIDDVSKHNMDNLYYAAILLNGISLPKYNIERS